MATYNVKFNHWVEVEAEDQWQAREIAADHVGNGDYNSSFEMFAEIEEVEWLPSL